MKKKLFSIVSLLTLLGLLLAACGSAQTESGEAGSLKILTSTTFLADITQNVVGDRAQVESLLPVGADPHAYQESPTDVAKIAESNVLILNGVEYEHFIESLLENAGGERLVIEATAGLEPHAMEEHEGDEHAEEEGEEEHGHEAGDPHMWLDPNLVITYAENIRDGLSEADPEGAENYKANADAYIAQLQELDAFIKEQVDSVPAERRLLVTNHEAMGYFAERYGFEVVDTIIPSLSTEASASAQEVAAAIEAIKATGAPAIFLGEVENADLANQIAAETGVKVVDSLYLETLTDGEPAATYINMMKYNVTQIVEGLK
ncbi:MAG: zinc ABC transporter substrate-binding protein [Anaerolineales bacterium]|nr:zinc ABC transporter substrate-binding protein [Anaerolineales bacterium]